MKRLASLAVFCVIGTLSASAQFAVGDNVTVNHPSGCATVRSALTTTIPALKCEPTGTAGIVGSGPSQWGDFPYYTVSFSDGVSGWIAGVWLQKSSGPVNPPPSGSLAVTPLTNGFATVSFSAKDDTMGILSPFAGEYSGALTVKLDVPTIFSLTLRGRGGERVYAASTLDGTPLPPPGPQLDSTAIANAAYDAGVLRGIVLGKATVAVDSVIVKLSTGVEVRR